MLTHIVRHVFRTVRPTNFKLGMRIEDDDPHQHGRHYLQGQRSRSQDHVISLSRLGPILYLCHYSPAGAYRVGWTRLSHFSFFLCLWVRNTIERVRIYKQFYFVSTNKLVCLFCFYAYAKADVGNRGHNVLIVSVRSFLRPFVRLLANVWTRYFEKKWTDFDAR